MLIISTTDGVDTQSSKYRINLDRGSAMDFGSLTVLDVRLSDCGTYSCNASNSIGSITAEADLTVHGKYFTLYWCSCKCVYSYVEGVAMI